MENPIPRKNRHEWFSEEASVGVSIMALMLVLVGLLGWMLAGSLLWMESVSGLSADFDFIRIALTLEVV